MRKKVIALQLYRRPEFTKRVLDALLRCYGIEDYHVILSIDYDLAHKRECDSVIWLADRFSDNHRNHCERVVHDPRLGIDANKLWMAPRAFEVSDFCIISEDDIIPARDALRFHEWAGEHFRNDNTILANSAWSKPDAPIQPNQENQYFVTAAPGFNCWMWSTWKSRWDAVIGDESAYRAFAGNLVNGRFDFWWRKWNQDHGTQTVFPHIARSQNIVGFDPDNRGEHWEDPGNIHNFNPYGIWDIPNLPDPDPKLWRMV